MFVYVMDKESKEILEAQGYTLLKEKRVNGTPSMWVFVNKTEQQFDNINVPCVVSDTLTF